MNVASEAIRKAYFTALDGLAITDEQSAAITLPFRDVVQTTDSFPYIYVIDQTANEFTSKDHFSTEATITLGVVTKFFGDFGGRQVGDEAVDKIVDIVRPDSRVHLDTTSDGHRIIRTNLTTTNAILQQYDDGSGYLHTITFDHLLNQL